MWHSLYHFLYITNREITVLCLCAMLPLDVMLFSLMSNRGLVARIIFGYVLWSGFFWSTSWFAEPARMASLEPIARELSLLGLAIQKAYRTSQALTESRPGRIRGLDIHVTKQQRWRSIIAGLAALVVAGVIGASYWLWTAYENNEDKENTKVEAIQTQAEMLRLFNQTASRYEHKLDSLLHLATANTKNIQTIKKQGEVVAETAKTAVRKAEQVERKVKRDELIKNRGKTVDAEAIETKTPKPNFVKKLLDRFGAAPVMPEFTPDTTGSEYARMY